MFCDVTKFQIKSEETFYYPKVWKENPVIQDNTWYFPFCGPGHDQERHQTNTLSPVGLPCVQDGTGYW